MEKVLLVARNVFRGILHRRILYVWMAAVGVLFLMAAPAVFLGFGNEGLQAVLRQRAVAAALDRWSTLCIALAIFMGASAIGSDKSWKTIVTVFARPITRWQYLLGKWIGVQCVSLLSLLLGLLVGLAIGMYLDADFEFRVLGISVAQSVVAIILYSGLATAVSTFATTGFAGALTVLIAVVPGAVTYLSDSPEAGKHTTGVLLDFVIPPGYTSHYEGTIIAEIPRGAFNFRNRLPGPRRGDVPPLVMPTSPQAVIDYDVEYSGLLQNIGYAAVFLVLGCLVFSRRDLKPGS